MARVLLDKLARNGSVALEGYGDQVGGQFLLMKFGDAVCKPLVRNEDQFYRCMSNQLKLFAAAYYGIINVCFEKQPSGQINVVAYPHRDDPPVSSTLTLDIQTLKVASGSCIPDSSNSNGGEPYVSPWSAECTKNSTTKLLALGEDLSMIRQNYIVLENLSSRFQTPSILDLKVGCCDHNDFESEIKKQKHISTSENSTTKTLRVRMAGMQRYDAARNEYVFRDKYYGRSLSEEGFYEELKAFLHNGVMFRSDLLPNIIHMLEELQRVIEKQDSFRFFSSSLLIIYDGADSVGVNGVSVGPSLDANTGSTSKTDSTTPPTPSLESDKHLPPSSNGIGNLDPLNSDPSNHTQQRLSELRTAVDVRMIDFARATCKAMSQGEEFSGCDQEYLAGLCSLLTSFKRM